MNKTSNSSLQLARFLMIAAILLIAGFQAYWIHRLYMDQAASFKRTTDLVFRETIYKVQAQRLRSDSFFYKYIPEQNNFMGDVAELLIKKIPRIRIVTQHQNRSINITTQTDTTDAGAEKSTLSYQQTLDSIESRESQNINLTELIRNGIKIGMHYSGRKPHSQRIAFGDTEEPLHPPLHPRTRPPLKLGAKEVLFKSRTLNDTISLSLIDTAYQKALLLNGISVPFRIKMDSVFRYDADSLNSYHTSRVPVGLLNKNMYQARFDVPTGFLFHKISSQLLLSICLVAFISITFLFLYRNLSEQRRLALIKNEFISNITHELKTPIATVHVAIEALRNFNALESPQKTREYLDISASELQRLSLLVDKVLKLSMFENRDIELQKVELDLKQLVEEVINSMRLQFEKQKASVSFKSSSASFLIFADKLHITSVVYNLLDNALKYSRSQPEIRIELEADSNEFILRVADNGMGIAPDFRDKIFDKFFRVPSGDHHNIKGYGLGLSYAAHVVEMHGGSISVQSEIDKGSIFIVKLPLR